MIAGTTEKLISYARGVGGRVENLRGFYLDAIAQAIVRAGPHDLPYEMQDLLASGRFRPSEHRLLRGLTVGELRARRAAEDARMWRRRKEIHGEQKFLAAERDRKRSRPDKV